MNAWSAYFGLPIYTYTHIQIYVYAYAYSYAYTYTHIHMSQTMINRVCFSVIKIGGTHAQMALDYPKPCRLNPFVPYKTVKYKLLCCHSLFLCSSTLRPSVLHTIGVSVHSQTNRWWKWIKICWLNSLWHFLGLIVVHAPMHSCRFLANW